MDVGRVFLKLVRLYVSVLVVLGLGTAVLILLPRHPLRGAIGAAWFAVGGFGALVLVIAVLIRLFE